MSRMKPKSSAIVGCLILAALLAPAFVSARDEAITPDSPQGQNVQSAIELIRKAGYDKEADQIEADLEDGDLYASDELDSDTNAETSAYTGNVTINVSIVGGFRTRPYNPKGGGFRPIAELARTLFHENIHANRQSFLTHVQGTVPVPGESIHETEAWEDSIHFVGKLLNSVLDDYRALLKSGASREELCKALDRVLMASGLLLETYE